MSIAIRSRALADEVLLALEAYSGGGVDKEELAEEWASGLLPRVYDTLNLFALATTPPASAEALATGEARGQLESPLVKRTVDLHEKASMPWAQAEELALSEFGFDDDDLRELIGEFEQCLEYLIDREQIENFARHVLVFGPDYIAKAPLSEILATPPAADSQKAVATIDFALLLASAQNVLNTWDTYFLGMRSAVDELRGTVESVTHPSASTSAATKPVAFISQDELLQLSRGRRGMVKPRAMAGDVALYGAALGATSATLTEAAQAVITARDNFGWSTDVDEKIEALRLRLADSSAAQPLTEEHVDHLADQAFMDYMNDRNDDQEKAFATAIQRAFAEKNGIRLADDAGGEL